MQTPPSSSWTTGVPTLEKALKNGSGSKASGTCSTGAILDIVPWCKPKESSWVPKKIPKLLNLLDLGDVLRDISSSTTSRVVGSRLGPRGNKINDACEFSQGENPPNLLWIENAIHDENLMPFSNSQMHNIFIYINTTIILEQHFFMCDDLLFCIQGWGEQNYFYLWWGFL